MNFIRTACTFLFMTIFCASYAHEEEYIFVGQNGHEGSEKTAFILELLDDDLSDRIQINENGEVYLKVDRIVAIPKKTFFQSTCLGLLSLQNNRNSARNAISDEKWTTDWECPTCGTVNGIFDFRCRNTECSTRKK